MTFFVLFILAVVWAVYLVSWVRSRTEHRRVNSIHSFSSHLSILERTSPESIQAPPVANGIAIMPGGDYFAPHRPKLSPQKKRRRDVLVGLAGATGVTFLGTVAMGGAFITFLFLVSAAAFGGYVYLLVQARKQLEERRHKVRPIVEHQTSAPSAPAASSDDSASESASESASAFEQTATVDDVFASVFGDEQSRMRVVGGN